MDGPAIVTKMTDATAMAGVAAATVGGMATPRGIPRPLARAVTPTDVIPVVRVRTTTDVTAATAMEAGLAIRAATLRLHAAAGSIAASTRPNGPARIPPGRSLVRA